MELFYIITGLVVLSLAVFAVFKMKYSWLKVGVVAVVALLVPLPVYGIWVTVAKDAETTFNEYWNGFEVAADSTVMTCVRDGSCTYTFDCDPYTEIYYVTVTDSKGNSSQEMRTRTEYHSCPYSTTETTWSVQTTLGTYVIDHNQTGEPFRPSVPRYKLNIVNEPPQFWAEVKTRIDAGVPNGVTKVNSYKNYILASDATILKEYSEVIEQYKTDGLMPVPTSGVHSFYVADKTHWVGFNEPIKDASVINSQVLKLGGAFGKELQGDLHMVFVNSSKVKNPDEYAIALKAYWASPEHGRNAIAKNTVTVIVGVDRKDNVSWSRLFTGMPVGNEGLEAQIASELKGLTVDETLVGNPVYDIASDTVNHTDGAIESILYGENKFQRVSMTATDEDDSGSGFNYLADAWEPSEGTMVGIYITSIVLVWVTLAVGFLFINATHSSGSTYPNRRTIRFV